MRSIGKFLFALILFAAVLSGVRSYQYDEPPADTPRSPTGNAPPAGPEIRVLFVGNSLVYSQNMPQMVQALAWSDGINLRVAQRALGGWTLERHASSADTRAKIDERDWHFVVIQEQSALPSMDAATVQARVVPGATSLSAQVRAAHPGARLLLYETPAWEPRAGYAEMQSRINQTYADLGSRLSAEVVHAGSAWSRVRAEHPDIQLYADDRHPNRAGAYLIACVFYRTLTGRSAWGNEFTAGLDARTAGILQSAADR